MSNLSKILSTVKSVKPVYWFVLVVAVLLVVISLYNRNIIQTFVGGSLGSLSGGSSEPVFTMYYVDWCPHCKAVKPLFTDFMGSGTVQVNGKPVKCTMVNAETNPDAVKGLNVKGYPSFLLNKGGNMIEFNGERTAEGFMSFLNQNMA
jgi:thiol-disulfide isomerase/thioredoxin